MCKREDLAVSSADYRNLRDHVLDESREPITWADKAMNAEWEGLSAEAVIERSPDLDQLVTPVMTLDAAALAANAESMATWAKEYGVELAPHGKTTMAPRLWLAQLDAGAWGITVANEAQLRVARGVGVPRIILANQFLRPGSLAWLARELEQDPAFEFLCWVDSVEGVRTMDAALRTSGAARRVRVCVEVGARGGRTGVRTVEAANAVARAVLDSPTLELAGTSGYEGGAGGRPVDPDVLGRIDDFLRFLLRVHFMLEPLIESTEAIVTAGGSTFFDRVAEILAPAVTGRDGRRPTRVIVRSGGYLIHDDGMYRRTTPSTRGAGPNFVSSMHVWSRVISIPEPGLALIDAGRRDVPYDVGLPEVQLVRRPAGDQTPTGPIDGCTIYDLNDQHGFMRIPLECSLAVGDVVRLGLSHPCTAFDKWRLIPVIDDADARLPKTVGLMRTYF